MPGFYDLSPDELAARLRLMAKKALRHWDIDQADISLADLRENAVFRIALDGTARYALRVHRYAYHTDAALNSELIWIRSLERDGIDVPQVVPTPTGDLFVTVQSEGVPEIRQVDLFEWIEGEQLGAATQDLQDDIEFARIYRTVGKISARLHNQAVAWTPPPEFTRHAWDVEGLTGEQPVWGRFWEHPALDPYEKALVQKVRWRLRDDLLAYGTSADRYSVIHSDILPENVLVQGERVRVIDFDDAGFGWHLYDIATTMADYRGDGRTQQKLEALVEGYQSVRALPDDELRHLDTFNMARSLATLGWVTTRAETSNALTAGSGVITYVLDQAETYLSR